MKKKIALFILVLLISLQPLAFTDNSSLAQEIQSPSTENCNSCTNKDPDTLPLKNTGIISDKKVINNIKKSLRNTEVFKTSNYKQGDFDWNNVEFLDYGENKNGLMVSYKKNDEKIDIRLLTAYDTNSLEISEIFVMKSIADNDQFKTTYTNLNGEEFVNFTVDMKTSEIIDVEVSKEQNITRGYGSRVVDCVISYWKNASGFTQTFCSGACGSVIFGGNAFGVAMCASCLGASALTCLIEEA